jgi:cellulose synthase/poly-beta-1,6-N-acetylglucosamine synthase-like glycosyltransferase
MFSLLVASFASLLSLPVIVLLIEVVAAGFPLRRELLRISEDEIPPRIAVLVPAHNESQDILPTIQDIKAQLRHGDRLVVIADNCSDDTAVVAAAAGAEVAVRNDPGHVGKGYALDYGIRYLSTQPPNVVVVIDADCRVAKGTIDRLALNSVCFKRPAQAFYLMGAAKEYAYNHRVAEFAWHVKNWVRPLGLKALNLPCQLAGTGMAFPWSIISSAEIASGEIVEDLRLGLNLSVKGSAPFFVPSALVTSEFPSSLEGAKSQRERWEHGHIRTILAAPRYIFLGALHLDIGLVMLALDMAVPPLSLLGLLLIVSFAITCLGALFGAGVAGLVISASSLFAFFLAILFARRAYGRDNFHALSASEILSVVSFMSAKIPLYFRFFTGKRVSQWIRTDRTSPKKYSSLNSDES